MGLVRQSVQRIADELEAEGIVRFAANPHHRRAKLVQLTDRGESLLAEVNERWFAVADTIEATVGTAKIARAVEILRAAREYLNEMQARENVEG